MATTTAGVGFGVGFGVGVGVAADLVAATAFVAVERDSSPETIGLKAHAAQIAATDRTATTQTRACPGRGRP